MPIFPVLGKGIRWSEKKGNTSFVINSLSINYCIGIALGYIVVESVTKPPKRKQMNRNWYLICTATNKENKVISLLTKKGIETFCPFSAKEVKISGSKTVVKELPLFTSYVFAFMNEAEIATAKKTAYVSNLAYWKTQSAVVNQNEISALKSITKNYTKICVEKIMVNNNADVTIKPVDKISVNNNSMSIEHKGVAATLPTIGFKVIAERKDTAVTTTRTSKTFFGKRIAASFTF